MSAPPPPDSTAVLRSLHARFGMASEVNVTVLAVLACDRARVQELLKSRCYGVMVLRFWIRPKQLASCIAAAAKKHMRNARPRGVIYGIVEGGRRIITP